MAGRGPRSSGPRLHSFFDWNIHAPANWLLACIVAGLAFSSVVPLPGRTEAGAATWPTATLRYAFIVACLGLIPLLARDAFTADTLDELRRANTAARVEVLKPEAPSAQPLLTAAIDRGERARDIDPRNWQLAAMLGQANLHLAVATQDPRSREAYTSAADGWFRKARQASAATRGLPEPLPPATR